MSKRLEWIMRDPNANPYPYPYLCKREGDVVVEVLLFASIWF